MSGDGAVRSDRPAPDAPQAPGDRVLTGWHLRALLLGCCLIGVVAVVAGETGQRLGTWSLLLTAVLVAGTVLLPGTAFPAALLVVLVVAVLDRDQPSVLRLLVTAAVLHAVHLLAGLCALGPATTRYRAAALRPTLHRWALAQLLASPVLLVVAGVDDAGLRGTGVGDGLEVAAGLVALALMAGTVALARRRTR